MNPTTWGLRRVTTLATHTGDTILRTGGRIVTGARSAWLHRLDGVAVVAYLGAAGALAGFAGPIGVIPPLVGLGLYALVHRVLLREKFDRIDRRHGALPGIA